MTTIRRIVDWKALSRLLCEQHNQVGVAHVRPWDPPGAIVVDEEGASQGPGNAPLHYQAVNISRDSNQLVSFPGTRLDPKKVRSELWKRRGERGLQREYFFLWSVYDTGTATSYVGWGAYVTPDVAARMDARQAPNGEEETTPLQT